MAACIASNPLAGTVPRATYASLLTAVLALPVAGENVADRVHLYNQHSFVCVGATRAPGYWDGAMVRSVRYRGNVVVGYGGFGISDFSTDILLDGAIFSARF